jgi:hypothetical protein
VLETPPLPGTPPQRGDRGHALRAESSHPVDVQQYNLQPRVAVTPARSGARPQPRLFTFILNRNRGRVTWSGVLGGGRSTRRLIPGKITIGHLIRNDAARSAIITAVRWVFARGITGAMDASTTKRFSTPMNRQLGSTTEDGSSGEPILHDPQACT